MLHSVSNLAQQAKVRSHYQEVDLQSKLETADPYTLVKILYEELENCLLVLKAVDGRKENIADHREAHRAHSIVVALLSGLSDSDNDTLCNILADVYHTMAATIRIIIRAGDSSQLDELLDGLANIQTAWLRIPDLK